MIKFNCSLCDSPINDPKNLKRRIDNSRSGLLFCSKAHKNEALKLARTGDMRFAKLVPQHYGIPTLKRSIEECPGCLRPYLPKTQTQKFCRSKCAQLLASRKKLAKWLEGEHDLAQSSDGSILDWARRHMMEEVQFACTLCRWSELSANGTIPLEIDHIDGNWKNSARENLRVICPNCHALTANYKVYNSGNEQSRYSVWKQKGWW